MAGGRRHLMIDPKRVPAKSTERNAKKRDRRYRANTAIIRKYQAELAEKE